MDHDRLLRAGVIIVGAYHLLVGVALAFAPHLFYRTLGGFDAYNRHYAGDNATWELAVGGGLVAAASRRSWRAPLLVVAAAQAVLHAVNHLIDIGGAHPRWVGSFDFAALTLLAVVLVYLAVVAMRPTEVAR
jgi:hypothetical protein